MKIKSFLVLILLINCVFAQESFVLDFKFKPNTNYLLRVEEKMSETLNLYGDSLNAAEMKKRGIETKVHKEKEFMTEQYYTSFGINEDGCFNVDMMLKDHEYESEVNGEETESSYPDFMKTAIVKSTHFSNGELKVREVVGENMKKGEKDFLGILPYITFKHFNFPKRAINVGESFSVEEKRDIMMASIAPIKVKITNNYKFEKTEDSKHYYTITSGVDVYYNYVEEPSKARGVGAGELVYNSEVEFVEVYNFDLEMFLEMKFSGLEVKLNQREEISIECEVQ